jgi:hypothetical protein
MYKLLKIVQREPYKLYIDYEIKKNVYNLYNNLIFYLHYNLTINPKYDIENQSLLKLNINTQES